MAKTGNAILDALPQDELTELSSSLTETALTLGSVLMDVDAPVPTVYFPTSGIISMVGTTPEGGTLEVALLGFEGVAGVSALFDRQASPWQFLVQADGHALTLPIDAFHEHIRSKPRFLEAMVRFSMELAVLMSKGAVCNRFHDLSQRLAFWLLCMHDRVRSDELTVTHEIAATMLGVHRPSLTVAMQVIERTRAIDTSRRGRIVVRDRARLEEAACSCYGLTLRPGAGQNDPA